MDEIRQNLLDKLRAHIVYVQDKVSSALTKLRDQNSKSFADARSLRPEDQAIFCSTKYQLDKRLEELRDLHKTPYFVKCELQYEDSGEIINRYFAKFQFVEESIYSWIAPIATIRFENPGKISYKLPDGKLKTAILLKKEQYMIVDGKVIFFTQESVDSPRKLIYQEHFYSRKSGFILPEVVAQMEKAQDQVVRAHYKGPLVISGPAGSGKTTLALHRIAYLVQAPDTALMYISRSVIVFVQDVGTKEYFSQLLPELGIKDVVITTFSEWAFSILELQDYLYVIRYGGSEEEKDIYEYEKLRILRLGVFPEFNSKPSGSLSSFYKQYMSETSYGIFITQKREKCLDRFDLTFLLNTYVKKYGKLKTGKRKDEVIYSLVLIDEFQNYLSEQLLLIKRCVDEKTKAVIYVGDLAQQINLGTVRSLSNINEEITAERNIALNKVYRNTKKILEYIQGLGYLVSIPEGIKEGSDIKEEKIEDVNGQILYTQNLLKNKTGLTVGILAKDGLYLEKFKHALVGFSNAHILTMGESQGVEFDVVCLVGISKEMLTINHKEDISKEHIDERKRIQKDLVYVALTRAISELHIIGTDRLGDIEL